MKRTLASLILASAVGSVSMLAQPPALHAQATQPAAAADAQQGVPVAQVVLFSSGVGYFEHAGTVQGDAQTELRFKTEQINDILKSLLVQDLDGGKVTTITYPSQDPVERTLASFQVNISGNPPLAELLNQLRGAQVELSAVGQQISGLVLGVEKRKVATAPDTEPVDVWFINILDGATIRQVELAKVSELRLKDQALQEELNKALAALAQSRDQDKKPVTIHFLGEGERRVRLGYVVETPIWKTSYRLVLAEQPKLQGWAIVENQTDNDWNNIQLSLVSGRPISFVQDLYQPLYVQRPVVVPELYASLRPRTYDAGIGGGRGERLQEGAAKADLARRARAADDAAPAPAAPLNAMAEQKMAPMDPTQSVQSIASAGKAGELFQYTVGNVTLPRQKSAMIPIITDDLEVEKLSIYNSAVLAKHPLYGARLKNTTGNHLLQGPVTVLDDGVYAGDARIDDIPPGQERYLSYGIDLELIVNVENQHHTSTVETGKLVKGVLHLTRKHIARVEYVAENKGEKDKTLVVEHALRPGWKLVQPEKPEETTQTHHRFKTAVPAGQVTKLAVQEELTQGEAIALLPIDIGALAMYARTGEIPQEVRDALAKAVQLKQALVDTQRQIAERQQRIAQIRNDQKSFIENMKVLDKKTTTYANYVKRLDEQEAEIQKLETEIKQLQQTQQERQKELEDYLNGLNVG
jgi:hypothetical protein